MKNLIKLKSNLEKKGYIVNLFNTSLEATSYLSNTINNKTIGFGGSVTLNQLGLFEILSKNNKVYSHRNNVDNLNPRELQLLANNSNIYFSSVNGVSIDGEIVNIDGTGNRVAAISFGPEEVFLIIGKNKIANSLEEAIYRARNIAAPLNAKKLNKNTPCTLKDEKCYNCNSPERICRILAILLTKPKGAIYHIILINENLGF